MKRPLQLPLAIALALGGTHALALGLGQVQVKSKLNQPLDAEIPVIQGTPGEAAGLLVNLAAAEDFDRVGLNRARLTVPLEFSLVKGANGAMVIKVTSKEAVRDTYLDFLVEANWPKGRLLREYTVLLDPPLTAPATHSATTSVVAAAPRSETVLHHEAPTQRSATYKSAPTAAPASARATPAPVAPKSHAGEYGPVEAGETLSGIARETRNGGASVDQMMLALLKSNPKAFYKDNINALKRGAILRIPSAEEIKAAGSASAAAAQVHAQIEDWRGGRASPTLVADTGAAPVATASSKPARTKTTTAANGKSGNERLELVPPKAGRDSLAMADRPGASSGNPAATAELKSELARTKETLTTREQESGELKSRVKELEDLKNKNDRLIGLKDSEIADLQQKLKQMREKTAAAAAAAAAKAASAPVEPAKPVVKAPSSAPVMATATPAKRDVPAKLDKADIWGDAGTSLDATTSGDRSKSTPASSAAANQAAPPQSPAVAAANSPASNAPGSSAATGNASLPPATPSAAPASAAPSITGATTTPLAPEPATNSSADSVAKKAAPSVVVVHPAKLQPVPPASAWYEQSWIKPAALGVGILLLLAGLIGMRKRKSAPAAAGRGSIADSFGESPLQENGGYSSIEAEEAELHDHIALDPSNVGLHLELLSLYYAEREVAKFEEAAANMHAYVTDPHEPEWLEAQAMGQELAPDNPLFAGAARYDDADAANATGHTITAPSAAVGHAEDHFAHVHDEASMSGVAHDPASEPDFHFGTGHHDTLAAPAMPAATGSESDGFTFDELPPLHPADEPASAVHLTSDLDTHVPPVEAPESAVPVEEDYFASDDAIGTKLDLARAYMDMGDPEGARSMLEEVIAEGNETQKAEAHRLIAEIH